jgi:hypothetical protein
MVFNFICLIFIRFSIISELRDFFLSSETSFYVRKHVYYFCQVGVCLSGFSAIFLQAMYRTDHVRGVPLRLVVFGLSKGSCFISVMIVHSLDEEKDKRWGCQVSNKVMWTR